MYYILYSDIHVLSTKDCKNVYYINIYELNPFYSFLL